MLKKAWNAPVWSKVIAAAIIGIASIFATFFLGWWPVIASAFTTTWKFLSSSTQTPNWVFLIIALVVFPSLLTLGGLILSIVRPDSPPDWTAYTSDIFLRLRWRWSYNGTEMSPPVAFCPECDYQIHPQEGFDYGSRAILEFECDNCSKTVLSFTESYDELVSKVKRLAQLKLRNGSWSEQGGT